MIVFLNGEFLDSREAQVSVFDHGFLYGDGCFETLRTYGGKLFQVGEHIRRLKKSAENLKITLPWSEQEIKRWMQETLQRNGFAESRLRITVTRGVNDFDFTCAKKPTILIIVTPLQTHPEEVYTQGVKVETLKAKRHLPQTKSLSLLPAILGQQVKKGKNVFETLFLNPQNQITEGTVSNFFVVKDGTIITAPDKEVLSGVTRKVVLELAESLGYVLEKRLFSVEEAKKAEEAFLTSTIMDIAPVVRIGEESVGNGKVGEITRELMRNFYKYIDKINTKDLS